MLSSMYTLHQGCQRAGACTEPRRESYLFHTSARGTRSRSSRTRSGSSPPGRRRCFGTGCSGTVWEAPWSRRVWPPWPSGSLPGVARPYSGRRWTDPGCSPRSRSWATPSTPRWGTPGPSCFPADPRGKGCHPGPGSRSRRGPCRQCVGCWWRWCLKIDKYIYIYCFFVKLVHPLTKPALTLFTVWINYTKIGFN